MTDQQHDNNKGAWLRFINYSRTELVLTIEPYAVAWGLQYHEIAYVYVIPDDGETPLIGIGHQAVSVWDAQCVVYIGGEKVWDLSDLDPIPPASIGEPYEGDVPQRRHQS